jgi:DNA-binding CsgD family transcriptional regulator
MNQPEFTQRQQEVIELLRQGKGNKQIALALGISERTVEDHLNHIYTMLGVASRAEAIIQLGKSTVVEANVHAGESTVAADPERLYLDTNEKRVPDRIFSLRRLLLILIGILIIVLLVVVTTNPRPWRYEREAEFPDEFTVGQDLERSNASGAKVHGQFGSESFGPWFAKPGFVRYYNIEIPKNGELYLQIRYSKFSKSSVPILIYLDDEQNPRESFYPADQGDWNKFTWTEWISLREITKGIHSIKFDTNGQEFGVADLDKFILTTEPP